MARRRQTTRPVTFRVPELHHRVLTEYAQARGCDLTAVLNGLVADALPAMESWLARQQTDLLAQVVRESLLVGLEQTLSPSELVAVERILQACSGAENSDCKSQVSTEAAAMVQVAMVNHWPDFHLDAGRLADLVVMILAAQQHARGATIDGQETQGPWRGDRVLQRE